MSSLTPVIKWPGAKWKLAARIVATLPAHRTYLEPFAGSLAVLFTKERSRLETVNDLDSEIVHFFRVLRERPDELAAVAALTPWAREEWEASFAPVEEPLERARRFLVRCQQSHGMRPRTRTGWRHATGRPGQSNGGVRNVARQWADLPPKLLDAAARLIDVQIEHRPALDVIARHAHPDCLIYADPPYPRSTRADWQYRHELTDDDHRALLAALLAHPGPVVLSGYACQLYDDSLGGWQREEIATTAEKGRPRTEIVWRNEGAAVRSLFAAGGA
jgi:DNA adenine methylase